MKKLTLLICLAHAAIFLHAQTTSIKGSILDTINKQKLPNTVVMLLRAKDSVLYKFAYSDKEGNFSFKNIAAGKYVMIASENLFADYLDNLTITDTTKTIDMGTLPMTLRAHMLEEVIVRQQRAAMRMKGDTLEYAADSFKVREGASVEDMLKKLPGVEIDKNGKITAQGQEVKKVLVDGEEFFGEDPTVATRGLPADAIDKVQVFDKKSDQATFTGVDDGDKTKTINLTLKANKKKGYFGKVELAAGPNNRWNNSAMINNFKNKIKVSAYGIMSSIGSTGLNWDDADKYGGGSTYDQEADYSDWSNDDLSNSNFYGEGVPKSWGGGINFSDKFSDDQKLNGSYRYNKLNTQGEGKTLTQSLLPDNFFVNRDSGNNYSTKQRHSASMVYEQRLDSTTTLKFIGSGYTGTSAGGSIYNSSIANEAGHLVNTSTRSTQSAGSNNNLNVSLVLRKKFKKEGRNMSLYFAEKYNSSDMDGVLYADLKSYDSIGIYLKDSITDQQKINNSRVSNFTSRITYTEPISKKISWQVNYAIRSNNSNSEKLSYDKNDAGKYETLNTIYSNNYNFDVLTNTTGTSLRYSGKKLSASAGSDIGFTNFSQEDVLADTVYKRSYTNLFPRATIEYKFNTTTRLSLDYNGRTIQPQINQIQPIKNNDNPLVLQVGNANLKQAFSHSFGAFFNTYNVLEQRGFFSNGNFAIISNPIVQDQFTDTKTGITTLRSVNGDGNYYYNLYTSYSIKLKKAGINTSYSLGFNGSKFSNVINNVNNTTYNRAPSIGLNLNKDKEKKYNINYGVRFGYNMSESSVSDIKTNYWTQTHNLNLNVTLPWKLEANTDINYTIRQKTDLFTGNNNQFIWNAYFGKRFLKNDKAIIKLQIFDLLNQNKGYDRTINSNVLTERSYQSLQRYFQLAINWNFTKSISGAAATTQP